MACGSSPEKAVPPRRKLLIEVFATSAYKQPTTYGIKTTTVSSGDIYAHPRAVIPSFGSKRGHVMRNGFKVGSNINVWPPNIRILRGR